MDIVVSYLDFVFHCTTLVSKHLEQCPVLAPVLESNNMITLFVYHFSKHSYVDRNKIIQSVKSRDG